MAEGAPLLREYVGKTCIEGSNPSGSATTMPERDIPAGDRSSLRTIAMLCALVALHPGL